MLFSSFVFHAVSSVSFLAQAAAPAGAQPRGSIFDMLVPILFFGVIFYFLLIRPQKKRAQEQAMLLSALRSGDEVVVNGMHGIVTNPRDAESKTVLVKFGENTKIEVDKAAITTVIKADGTSTTLPKQPANARA